MKYLYIFFLLLQINILSGAKNLPNIVLIVSDDHGSNDLGCYGNNKIKTPNLDRLAEEGIRFTNAYATSASCSPSRSVILTGLYSHSNGIYGLEHHFHHFKAYKHLKSLPVLLEQLANYRTARIGKYHIGPESVFRFQKALEGNPRNSVEMSNNSKEFIDENSNSPFFLYYCTTDPHRGGGKVEENVYKPDRFGNIPSGYSGVNETTFDLEDVKVPSYLPDTPECRAELAQYYQSVARMDQGIGVLFDFLKDAEKWDNTIVIYISDNGIAFPGAKTNVYQAGINIPCIIKYPKAKEKNIVCTELINWADLTPTILDIAGVLPDAEKILSINYDQNKNNWDNTVNESFHGRSFKSILEGNKIGDWNYTYASHTFHEITMYYPMRVVIEDDYKLIWNIAHNLSYPHAQDLWESATWQSTINNNSEYYSGRKVKDYSQRPEFELYNIKDDPNELVNLAYKSEFTKKLNYFERKLKHFQQQTNDPWVVKWDHE